MVDGLVDRSAMDVWWEPHTKKRRILNGDAGLRKRDTFWPRSEDPVFGCVVTVTCSRGKTETGVVRLLVDVWWHLLPRAGDCAGGRKVVPEVTLCWQSPRVRFLFRQWPAAGRRAWWNRLSFLGKCSSVACLGRPVQVCDICNSDRIVSIWQFWFGNSANGGNGIHRSVSRSSPVLQERESKSLHISLCAFLRSLFTDLYAYRVISFCDAKNFQKERLFDA